MPTMSEVAFVNTNVLVYATDESSLHHASCLALCERGINDELALCVSAQILAEFISVATNPNAMPHPLSVEQARSHAESLSEGLRVIVTTEGVTARFFKLLRATGANGKRAHDILHAATMLENGIRTIYTFDVGFTRIPEIVVRTPNGIMTGTR